MQRTNREIAVGTLTVGLFIALSIWLSAQSGGATATADGYYRLNAVFNKVDGLLPGDDVRLGGIRIGTVERQRLDDRYRAVLTLAIASDVALPVDTSAAIHTNGLFGSKFIVLEPGGDFDNLVDGDGILFTQDSLVVEDLLDLIINEGKARQRAAAAASGN